jgi:tRNA (cytidine/uridine-2'-O-)-methyltransferase
MLHIALINPPHSPNTGNIARLCAATDTSLHLIEPLGFSIADADLKRAGLDYWESVDLWIHPGWRAFREAMARERCLYFFRQRRAAARRGPLRAEQRAGPSATRPTACRTASWRSTPSAATPSRCRAAKVRSLNLATAAGIVPVRSAAAAGQRRSRRSRRRVQRRKRSPGRKAGAQAAPPRPTAPIVGPARHLATFGHPKPLAHRLHRFKRDLEYNDKSLLVNRCHLWATCFS